MWIDLIGNCSLSSAARASAYSWLAQRSNLPAPFLIGACARLQNGRHEPRHELVHRSAGRPRVADPGGRLAAGAGARLPAVAADRVRGARVRPVQHSRYRPRPQPARTSSPDRASHRADPDRRADGRRAEAQPPARLALLGDHLAPARARDAAVDRRDRAARLGRALGYVIFHYVEGSRIPETGDTLVALGITLFAYGLAELAHGYGFLAVFVTALILRQQERSHHYRARLHEFSEQLERLFMMVLLVLFGGALAGELLAPLTWGAAAIGLLCLFAVRPLAGLVALAGSGLPFDERAAISFFGIRGVGSFYYLAYAYNTEVFGKLDFVFALVGFVVLGSILLHGLTAAPVMRWLDRRWRAAAAARH